MKRLAIAVMLVLVASVAFAQDVKYTATFSSDLRVDPANRAAVNQAMNAILRTLNTQAFRPTQDTREYVEHAGMPPIHPARREKHLDRFYWLFMCKSPLTEAQANAFPGIIKGGLAEEISSGRIKPTSTIRFHMTIVAQESTK